MGNQCTGPGGQLAYPPHLRRRSATSASFNDSMNAAVPTKEPRGTETKNHPKKHYFSLPHPPRALLFLRPDASPRSTFSSSVPSTSYANNNNSNMADAFDIRKTASSLSLGPSGGGSVGVNSPLQTAQHYTPSSTFGLHPDRLSGDDDNMDVHIAHHHSIPNEIGSGEEVVDQLGFPAEPFYLGGSEAEYKQHEEFHRLHHHHHHDHCHRDDDLHEDGSATGFGVEDDFCQLSKRFRTKRFRTRLELGII